METSERREAFFALIAPIGVDLESVSAALEQALKAVSYECNEIRLTNIFKDHSWYSNSYNTELERYSKLIKAGDSLCKDSRRKDILALYGIAQLSKFKKQRSEGPLPENVVHVFRQIKRVEEIKTLQEIYGRNILFLSCYSPRKDRVANLVKKMLKTERGLSRSSLESKALEIISLDEDEKDDPNGQRVIECYPYADFVIDCTTHNSLAESAGRLINIFFGNPFVSPTKDEYCSYIANAASYRSLDLSRQVGAAIFGDNCEVISMGCNEVPKAGGGTYWSGSSVDFRDYAIGHDSNQKVREDMTRDALVRLQGKGWLSEKFTDSTPDELVSLAFNEKGNDKGPLSSSMMKDIIEYGRMVHAEMNALADAARFRRSTIDSTLYCTTMPCHMCTKLIIAAGVTRVVYVQPYGKSLVEELFNDSVAIDDHPEGIRVTFDSLKGVTPNGFKRAFHKIAKRKNSNGNAQRWDQAKASPSFLSNFPFYVALEQRSLIALEEALTFVEESAAKARTDASLDVTSHNAETRLS